MGRYNTILTLFGWYRSDLRYQSWTGTPLVCYGKAAENKVGKRLSTVLCRLCHADPNRSSVWTEFSHLTSTPMPLVREIKEKKTNPERQRHILRVGVSHHRATWCSTLQVETLQDYNWFNCCNYGTDGGPTLKLKQERCRVHTSPLNQAVQSLSLFLVWVNLTHPPPALPFLSLYCFQAPLSDVLFHPTSSHPLPICLQTENVRWANATHSFTEENLGLLLQGFDRLLLGARFSLCLHPCTCQWASMFFFLIILFWIFPLHLLMNTYLNIHKLQAKF